MATEQASQSVFTPGPSRYGRLAAMGVLSLAVTYLLTFAAVDVIENVVPNLNSFYLAGLITTVLGVLELVVMRDMYRNPRANAALIAGLGLAALVFFSLIRQQAAIGDEQLMRSMIPHHAVAIHMCQGARLQDQELTEMCDEMIAVQQREIERLKNMLRAANE